MDSRNRPVPPLPNLHWPRAVGYDDEEWPNAADYDDDQPVRAEKLPESDFVNFIPDNVAAKRAFHAVAQLVLSDRRRYQVGIPFL